MQGAHLKKKSQKMVGQKERAERTNLQSEGIPGFMIRFAREQRLKIFEGIALPKYRHD